MTDRHRQLADKVVTAFKQSVSAGAREQITHAQFEGLALMIREVIAEELGEAARLVEEVLQKLRADIEKPELGM